MKNIFLFILLTFTTPLAFSNAEQAYQFGAFKKAKALTSIQPTYPKNAARRSKEGYVVYTFIIEADGTISNPYVIDSYGLSIFEKTTLRALKKFEWQPATLNGEPVASSHQYKFSFRLSNQSARPAFVDKYKKFGHFIQEKKHEEALTVFEDVKAMKDLNFYEIAYLNVIQFYVGTIEGDLSKQIRSLNSVLRYQGGDEKKNFLPKALADALRLKLFELEAGSGYYLEAKKTYELAEEISGINAVAPYESAYKKLLALETSDIEVATLGHISGQRKWSLGLLRKAFYLDEVQGEITKVSLHCQAHYNSFPYSEGAQYNIPASWGKCEVGIVGAPDTAFRVVQLNPAAQ